MEKLMSCDTNTEIMETLFEQVQEEYPDLTFDLSHLLDKSIVRSPEEYPERNP